MASEFDQVLYFVSTGMHVFAYVTFDTELETCLVKDHIYVSI